jgi:hypothetical protein
MTTIRAGGVKGPASAADNALVCFDGATGKLLQSAGIPFVTPQMFGGSIQDAIDSGHSVYIPAGTYNITAALVADNAGQRITGAGKELTIIAQTTDATNGIEISASDVVIEHLTVKDITDTLDAGEFWGIVVLAEVGGVVVQHCTVKNCDDAGIRFGYDHVTPNTSAISSNCRALFCDVETINDGAGIECINSDRPLVMGCTVTTVATFGIRLVDCHEARAIGNRVNNWGTSGTGAGILAAGGSLRASSLYNIVADNTLLSGTADTPGILVQTESQYANISNNTISMDAGAAAAGILLDATTSATVDVAFATITGNIVRRGTRGIEINGAASSGSININGGVLNGFTEYGILITDGGSLGSVSVGGGIILIPADSSADIGISTNATDNIFLGDIVFVNYTGANTNNRISGVLMQPGETRYFRAADDAFVAIPMEKDFGGIRFEVTNGLEYGSAHFRVSSGTSGIASQFVHANVDFTTGALNGTTGSDGKFTVSAHTDGNVYVENRIGGAREFLITVF